MSRDVSDGVRMHGESAGTAPACQSPQQNPPAPGGALPAPRGDHTARGALAPGLDAQRLRAPRDARPQGPRPPRRGGRCGKRDPEGVFFVSLDALIGLNSETARAGAIGKSPHRLRRCLAGSTESVTDSEGNASSFLGDAIALHSGSLRVTSSYISLGIDLIRPVRSASAART